MDDRRVVPPPIPRRNLPISTPTPPPPPPPTVQAPLPPPRPPLLDTQDDALLTPRRRRRKAGKSDGTFSFNEFVEIVCNMGAGGERPPEDEEKELRDAFKIFDKHERGYICASDLRAVLRCLGEDLSEEEIEDMIREVDIDGDGRIDFKEFVKALGENDDDSDEEDEEGAEAAQE